MTEKSPQIKLILHSNIGLRVKLSQHFFFVDLLFVCWENSVYFFFELSLSRVYIMYRKL